VNCFLARLRTKKDNARKKEKVGAPDLRRWAGPPTPLFCGGVPTRHLHEIFYIGQLRHRPKRIEILIDARVHAIPNGTFFVSTAGFLPSTFIVTHFWNDRTVSTTYSLDIFQMSFPNIHAIRSAAIGIEIAQKILQTQPPC
jgi:hypothetical protein